jgi:polysaccharide export outer membrane protein
MSKSINGAVLGVVALLCGCTPGANLPLIANYQTEGYLLGGGDQIRIITFGEDQLTGDFRVNDEGNVALPLVGVIKAADMTPAQVAGEISSTLRAKHLITDPSVAVEVASYRPVFVLGEVAKPGQYAFQPGMTMLTAVAVAGGFTYRGVHDYAGVVRTVDGKAIQGKITPSSFVAPGDVINVYERNF